MPFGYFHSIHATMAPMSTSCHTAIIVLHGIHSKMKLLMTHLHQQPYILSGAMKAIQK